MAEINRQYELRSSYYRGRAAAHSGTGKGKAFPQGGDAFSPQRVERLTDRYMPR